ncbi:putative nuclease HARBI1 isoform X2 [Bactrocera dorsalis]|uniref:Putative nuclease HARBI1 n=1 Tax=Bactrocera dorsalis TaxID=27457 RepID=A0ABM3K887_BACDO|nr:putative nuclease HARBI1 isoform X2 [Bactrocera dorsalis]
MSLFTIAAYLLAKNEWEKNEKVRRRILRDHSNPLDIPDSVISKEAFLEIVRDVQPFINPSSITIEIKLATTLRYLAEGGFQRSVGKDTDISLARSTVCKVLHEVLNALEKALCPKWIKLQMSEEEIKMSKAHFFNNFCIPGIIGCVDGTHIKITKPHQNEHLFFNRKGYFSVNAMIICDYRMRITAVDACHPGASHDAFIFSLSAAKQYLSSSYVGGDHRSWLLGDSGYGLEPYLLTPYRDANAGSPQHKFNLQHSKARNIVERVIGVLKSRFKCLQTTMPYVPEKVVKIINICSAMHNICRHYNLDAFALDVVDDFLDEEVADHSSHLQTAAVSIRDEIANNLTRIV